MNDYLYGSVNTSAKIFLRSGLDSKC